MIVDRPSSPIDPDPKISDSGSVDLDDLMREFRFNFTPPVEIISKSQRRSTLGEGRNSQAKPTGVSSQKQWRKKKVTANRGRMQLRRRDTHISPNTLISDKSTFATLSAEIPHRGHDISPASLSKATAEIEGVATRTRASLNKRKGKQRTTIPTKKPRKDKQHGTTTKAEQS